MCYSSSVGTVGALCSINISLFRPYFNRLWWCHESYTQRFRQKTWLSSSVASRINRIIIVTKQPGELYPFHTILRNLYRHHTLHFQILFGISTLLSPICRTFEWLLIYGICFGFLSGSYALMMVIPVDLLGQEKFSAAYGFLLAGEGMGLYLGPPLAGRL